MLLTFILIKVQIIMMFFLLFISSSSHRLMSFVGFVYIDIVQRWACKNRTIFLRSLSLSLRSYQSFEAKEEQSVNVD